MITIEKINRAYKLQEIHYRIEHNFITRYIETEKEFLKGVERLCNTIGKENIISVQFFNGERNTIDNCIIVYEE